MLGHRDRRDHKVNRVCRAQPDRRGYRGFKVKLALRVPQV